MKRRISLVGLVALGLLTAFVIIAVTSHVEHRNRVARLNAPANLKMIGLSFRQDHNSLSRQFVATGEVVTPLPAP